MGKIKTARSCIGHVHIRKPVKHVYTLLTGKLCFDLMSTHMHRTQQAMLNTFRSVFPSVSRYGCFYHFSQCIYHISALIVPSAISPTFQSSSNVLSLAAYLITCPLSTSYQPNSQLTGLSIHRNCPTVRRQRPCLCHRQWQSVTACTIRSQCGFRHRRSSDTAVGIRKPVFHGLHRSPLV